MSWPAASARAARRSAASSTSPGLREQDRRPPAPAPPGSSSRRQVAPQSDGGRPATVVLRSTVRAGAVIAIDRVSTTCHGALADLACGISSTRRSLFRPATTAAGVPDASTPCVRGHLPAKRRARTSPAIALAVGRAGDASISRSGSRHRGTIGRVGGLRDRDLPSRGARLDPVRRGERREPGGARRARGVPTRRGRRTSTLYLGAGVGGAVVANGSPSRDATTGAARSAT